MDTSSYLIYLFYFLFFSLNCFVSHTNCTSGITLTFPPADKPKIITIADDDSSGDEEIVEDSSSLNFGGALPVPSNSISIANQMQPQQKDSSVLTTFNRYNHLRKEMVDCIWNTIESKAGVVDGVICGSFGVITTMTTFCHVPRIRYRASKCLDAWISNPAFIEHVKYFIVRLADFLELEDSNVFVESGVAYNSDMEIVESIVNLKSKLQTSQLEVYRSILATIVKKGSTAAQLVVRILTMSCSGISSSRQDTLKTLIHILKAVAQVDNDEAQGAKRSGTTFGEAVGQICRSAADVWSAGHSKNFIELVLRVIRGLDASKIDASNFLVSLLGDSRATAQWIYNSFSVESEIFKFYADVAVALQLINSHDIAMLKSSTIVESVGARAPIPGRGALGRGGSNIMRGGLRPAVPTLKKFSLSSTLSVPSRESSEVSTTEDLSFKSSNVIASSLLRGILKIQETAALWISQVAQQYRQQLPKT